MARPSKYDNHNTPLSVNVITTLAENAKEMTINEIEESQMKYGISDVYLAEILGLDKSQISRIKKGNSPIPSTGKIALFLFFLHMENLKI